MTNPNDAIGTNAGFNGRTSPNAFNDTLANYTGRGILSGWTCSPKSGMTVQLGGSATDRDVAVAEDNAGNRTTINNRSGLPVDVTISGAPSTGNRIDLIVAYVNNPQNGAGSSDVDFPSQVGFIAVKGTAASSPSAPTNSQIRTAITADGADGTSAYYVVLASITVGQGVTTIGSGVITQGAKAVAGVMTTINAAPSNDTPSAWATVLGGKPGLYITELTTTRFTNQPSSVGVLRTTITSNFDRLEQEFTQLPDGVKYYRCGNETGWWGQSGGSGAFRKIIDDSQSTDTRLDLGKWHFYYTSFGTTTAGWQNQTIAVPSDFGNHIVSVLLSAAYGNSGNNYGCTWFGQTATSVQVRFNQGTAGSNGWYALVIAIF